MKLLTFQETDDQKVLRETISSLASRFPDEYWRDHDLAAEFPQEYFDALAKDGWFKLNVPEAYGGAGLGIAEVSIVIHEIAKTIGMSASDIMMINSVFGTHAVKSFASDPVKRKLLPEFGETGHIVSFCHTEPSAGVNTFDTATTATREGDGYVINGQKIWITLAHKATIMTILTRTTPKEKAPRRTEGLTLFLLDRRETKRGQIRTKKIDDISMRAFGSNEVYFEDIFVPSENVLGQVDKAWEILPSLLNGERISTASMSIGLGELVMKKATEYARSRRVYGRAIGSNQPIQFPLASAKSDRETAWAITQKAAWEFENQRDCSVAANIAAYEGAKAAFFTADRAIQTYGGMGFAKSSDIERHWRDSRLFRAGPVPEEMVLNFLAQRLLKLPRSF